MKKIFYYLLFIVLAGGATVSFWVYQRYFKIEVPKFLTFAVVKGDIQDVVKVRGEVVPQKDFALEFPFVGNVEKVFVTEGQQVNQGDPLMKLEITDFELEIKKLDATMAQSQANLDKLIAGPIQEDLRVSETKVENARASLGDAKRNFADKLREAYTASDDAIQSKADQFFDNPRTSNPQIKFSLTDSQLGSDIEFERVKMETTLKSWESSLGQLATQNSLTPSAETAQSNLDQVKLFLDKVALAVNSATQNSNTSQATLDTWKSNTTLARVNINVSIAGLSAAREKSKIAESNLALAEDELTFKRAKARTEDVQIAEAKIEEIEGQIAIMKEKIKKSTLYAPVSAKIIKVGFERQELLRPGQTAITLATSGHKIQADISELEIGKIREGDGNEVSVRFDAFPGRTLDGKVISVDAKEIIKEGDKYYRANIYLDPHGTEIRSGMNADLMILISSRENVLKIPEFAVYKKDGNKFVTVLKNGKQEEVKVETGISDGKSVEITKGLTLGQTITVSAD
ncbi:MAG: efflux RND transporter periplasmic adaptor subunit [bacterium]|nr:efflux RND transporter periplasmic adaptor subunit [bacterium]